MAKIGFIGLGTMGCPMAANIVRGGHQVSGFDVDVNSIKKHVANGGLESNSASEAAKDAEIVFTMLPNSQHVNTALFEKDTERDVYELVNCLEPIAKSLSSDNYKQLAHGLASGANVLSEFFDGDQSVMVMTEDIKVRTNRLNLLAVLRNQALLIADFNLITH